jgi:hypothetical protein
MLVEHPAQLVPCEVEFDDVAVGVRMGGKLRVYHQASHGLSEDAAHDFRRSKWRSPLLGSFVRNRCPTVLFLDSGLAVETIENETVSLVQPVHQCDDDLDRTAGTVKRNFALRCVQKGFRRLGPEARRNRL